MVRCRFVRCTASETSPVLTWFSQDGDALMFGCTTLIRQHKTGNERVKDHIRVYNATALKDKYDLNPDGLVLFAVLAGGDYDTAGLKGCGPSTAHRLSRSNVGLSQALRNSSQADLPAWRMLLQQTMIQLRIGIYVPPDFPAWKPLNYYRNPTVSIPERLFDLRGLRHGWDLPIKQPELRIFLRERFNFTTREFLKHIAPIFVARRVARAHTDQQAGSVEMGIELKRTRKKNHAEEDVDDKTEAKITFSPLSVVDIDLSQCPPEEDWTKFEAKDGTPYDPTRNVEAEILHCFLKHGLPDGALEYAKPVKRKRKAEQEQSPDESSPSKKRTDNERDLACARRCPSKKSKTSSTARSVRGTVEQAAGSSGNSNALPKKRGRPKKQQSASSTPHNSSTSNDKNSAGTEAPASLDVPVFRQPHALLDLRASIIDLGDDDDSAEGDDSLRHSVANDVSGPAPPQARSPSPLFVTPTEPGVRENHELDSSTYRLIPGEAISPKALRELRAAGFLGKRSSRPDPGAPVKPAGSLPASSKLSEPVVIDLT